MINVLIVDDELLVRTNLKSMIDWEAEGLRICGEAANGADALKLIEKWRSGIVLMDILMPGMNGYELSSVIRERYPAVLMIVLSNYDDFEYVRGTLRNGAVDYLLKHNLNSKTLLDSLARAKSAAASLTGNADSEPITRNHMLALTEKFVQQLLAGLYRHTEEIRKQLDLLDVKLDCRNVVPVVMEIDSYGKSALLDKKFLKDHLLLSFSVVNIIEELLNERGNGVVTRVSDKRFAILLSFANARSQAYVDAVVGDLLQAVSASLKKFLEFSVSFSIGNSCASILDVQKSYEDAAEQLNGKFYLGRNAMIKGGDGSFAAVPFAGLDMDTEREIVRLLEARDTEAVLSHLADLFADMKRTAVPVAGAKMVFYDLLTILWKFGKERKIDVSSLSPDGQPLHEKIATIDTIDEYRDWMASLIANLIDECLLEEEAYPSAYVREAVQFVKRNYANNVSLSEAAEHVHIGGAYLSTLFKEEVGVGFSEYLRNLRIAKAKSLLEQGKLDLREIVATCGFNDYDYFLKAFKKTTGMTPKEYTASKRRKKP